MVLTFKKKTPTKEKPQKNQKPHKKQPEEQKRKRKHKNVLFTSNAELLTTLAATSPAALMGS